MKFQPAIKWSGSKRSQSEEIVSKIKNKEYDTYYEPFCGGCSVLFQLLHSDIKFKRYVCSDINNDLISLWNEIKYNPNKVIDEYTRMWNELNIDNDIERKKIYYNNVRERFNNERSPYDFMFIMRTAVNGMPRYNKDGNFNTSFHVTRNGIQPNKLKKIILEWSKVLNEYNVEFITMSYEKIQTNKNDLMYLDPPYANTKGMYYGAINNDWLWNWLRNQECSYLLSFDGKTSSEDMTYNIPIDIYDRHEYIYSGNSSLRRLKGKTNEYVSESLYIKEVEDNE